MLMNELSFGSVLKEHNYSSEITALQREMLISTIAETFEVSMDAARVRLKIYDDYFCDLHSISYFKLKISLNCYNNN